MRGSIRNRHGSRHRCPSPASLLDVEIIHEIFVPGAGERIDAYFDTAPEFARAICRRLQTIILKADPAFDSLAYTHRKAYIRWIEGAKKAETRRARVLKTIEMLKAKIKHP